MSEDVFSQLRRLVRVEDEVRQLQESILHQGQREELTEGAAVLLLRELQNDLKKLKMESRRTLSSACDDQGFMTLVPLCEKLLQHQVTAFSELQTHLSQYGYTPPPTADNDGDKPVEEIEPPTSPSSCQSNQQPAVANTPQCNAEETKGKGDLDRTPTLEDFGLSETRMVAILIKNRVFKEPPAPTLDPKLQMYSEYRPPSSINKWSSSESIPDTFKNAPGIAITPGLFNGRSVSTITPGKHLGGPALGSPAAPTPKQKLLSSLASDGSDTFSSPQTSLPIFSIQSESGDDNSPQPPVFTTPGVKQLYKPVKPFINPDKKVVESGASSRDTSPAFPLFNTPGLNKLYRPRLVEKENIVPGNASSDTSPAYPVFTTPGLNKIVKKAIFTEEDHTPDAPEFCTPHLQERLQSKLTYTKQPAMEQSSVDADEDSLESPQLTCATTFLMSQTKRKEVDPTLPAAPRLAMQSRHEDLEMPETPELTFNFSNFRRPLQQKDTQVTQPVEKINVADTIRPNPVSEPSVPTMTHSHHTYLDAEDDDLPPEPELTCNFSKHLLSKPTIPTTSATVADTTAVVKPQVIRDDTQNDATALKVEIVKPLTCDEYVAQPSWVQRQLSLDMLEKAVKRINAILAQKIKEGKALTLNEKEVAPMTLSFALVNTNRILLHRATSVGTTYTVVQRP